MAKVRVYELAKELGVESKTVLTMLRDMGEFVRSASSTVEAPVERRLKEKLASEPPPAKKTAKKAAPAKAAEAPAATAPAGCGRGRPSESPAAPRRRASPPAPTPAAPAAAGGVSAPAARGRQRPRRRLAPYAERASAVRQRQFPGAGRPPPPGRAAPARSATGRRCRAAAPSWFDRRPAGAAHRAVPAPRARETTRSRLPGHGPVVRRRVRDPIRRSSWRPAPAGRTRPAARRASRRTGHAPAQPGDDAAAGLRPARQRTGLASWRPAGRGAPGAAGRGRPGCRCPRSRRSRWGSRRSAAQWARRPRWSRWHPGCLRPGRWSGSSWPQVQEAAPSRVRPDGGAVDRRRHGSSPVTGRTSGSPAAHH